MTNAGVIDSDYRGEVKVVLANLGDQPYCVEKGDRIAQLNIEKFDNRKLQEVTQLDDTERGDPGFGSSDTTMDQEVKGQKAKPKMEINEISARAFGQFYRRGETTGILRWDEIKDEIQLEAINISTELAIKKQKTQRRPGRERHGPPRRSPPIGHLRKRREDDGTAPPAGHRSGNRPGRRKDVTNKKNISPELQTIGGTPPIHQTERRSRMDAKGKVGKGFTNYICQEKGWQTQALRRL